MLGSACHSDGETQFTSPRCGERIAEIGDVPPIGIVGAATVTLWRERPAATKKGELIYRVARTTPWKTVEDVELATLGWFHLHNTIRLRVCFGDTPPTELQAAFYAAQWNGQSLVEIK